VCARVSTCAWPFDPAAQWPSRDFPEEEAAPDHDAPWIAGSELVDPEHDDGVDVGADAHSSSPSARRLSPALAAAPLAAPYASASPCAPDSDAADESESHSCSPVDEPHSSPVTRVGLPALRVDVRALVESASPLPWLTSPLLSEYTAAVRILAGKSADRFDAPVSSDLREGSASPHPSGTIEGRDDADRDSDSDVSDDTSSVTLNGLSVAVAMAYDFAHVRAAPSVTLADFDVALAEPHERSALMRTIEQNFGDAAQLLVNDPARSTSSSGASTCRSTRLTPSR
jgi:hypothetical protein